VGAGEGVVCGGKTNLIDDGFRLIAAVRPVPAGWDCFEMCCEQTRRAVRA
jgi:hypothetical protein